MDDKQPIHLVIEGSRITDIPSFYAEINRVFMADEDWKLGESLDALDDLLYGGYGAAPGGGRVVIEWRDMELSRMALGVEATRDWLMAKLDQPERFNGKTITAQLEALELGEGQSYFDIVMEVFAGHARISLNPLRSAPHLHPQS
ncbi:barstar family protein [Ketogulonicigenium vulgare]|uniref:barstar family protein n=1 Tax=Ketogulonicigenium vulgare TaxID=92945 RepID=UPI00235A1C8C|nr:barstar family protein [Ketogulonicigenium vulgare]